MCRKCEVCNGEKCLFDAFVVIKDGELTHGAIDEAAYGSFSGKILDTIVKEYGSVEALLERSAKDPSKIYCGGQPEGIVIRPMVPEYCDLVKGMLSMKVINNKYLLKG